MQGPTQDGDQDPQTPTESPGAGSPLPPASAFSASPRRRGRPTKAEVAARAAADPAYAARRAAKPTRGALSTAVAEDLQELEHGAHGLRVWQWLSMREFKLWPSLVIELQPEQRASLVLHLLCKGHAAVTIANKLGLMPNLVKDIWRDYTAKVGDDVMGITLPSLVGRIDSRAEALVEMAVEEGRPDRAWKIEKERVQLLQDLGVVERASKRYEVAHQHTLRAGDAADAETQAEVDRILDLERKRRESGERVKRIDARIMDHVPTDNTKPQDDDE